MKKKEIPGSWINLPYHGRNRYALNDDGAAIFLEQFLNYMKNI